MFSNLFFITLLNIRKYFSGIHFSKKITFQQISGVQVQNAKCRLSLSKPMTLPNLNMIFFYAPDHNRQIGDSDPGKFWKLF